MKKIVVIALGALLCAGVVAYAQNINAWRGQLEEVVFMGDQQIQLRFFETPEGTGGAIALGRDETNVCRTRNSFDDFVYALNADADRQIWGVTSRCSVENYVAVCLDLSGRGRSEMCTSFTLLLWDIEWIE